jgi:hypothetical protein
MTPRELEVGQHACLMVAHCECQFLDDVIVGLAGGASVCHRTRLAVNCVLNCMWVVGRYWEGEHKRAAVKKQRQNASFGIVVTTLADINNNNNNIYLTAIGSSPGGKWFLSRIQEDLKCASKLCREGYMRSMQCQLGNLGTISAFALKTQGNQYRKPVSRWPVAWPSEHWHLASSPASKVGTTQITTIHCTQYISNQYTKTHYFKYLKIQYINYNQFSITTTPCTTNTPYNKFPLW